MLRILLCSGLAAATVLLHVTHEMARAARDGTQRADRRHTNDFDKPGVECSKHRGSERRKPYIGGQERMENPARFD